MPTTQYTQASARVNIHNVRTSKGRKMKFIRRGGVEGESSLADDRDTSTNQRVHKHVRTRYNYSALSGNVTKFKNVRHVKKHEIRLNQLLPRR